MEDIRVTGSLQTKTTKKGKTYYYTVIAINGGKPKWESTGLEVNGNKRKAAQLLRQRLYEYEQKARQEEEERLLAGSRKKGNMLFSDWMQTYINGLGTSIRASTLEGYQYRLKHITNYFADKPITLSELTAADINEFVSYLLRYGKLDSKTGERSGLAVRTVRAIKALIVSALKQATILGYITVNPALNVKVGSKPNHQLARKFNYMQGGELNRFFQYLDDMGDPMADIVKVIACYGLRRSEAVALKFSPDSVDMVNRRLQITQTVVKVKTKHREQKTKSVDSLREFKIIDDMYALFQKILAQKEENKKFYGNTYYESDNVFTWEDGMPFDVDYLYHHFSKIAAEFGRPGFTLHNLRHSCASFLFEQGWREWEIAAWLGHSDPTTTKRWYTVLRKAHNDEKAESLNGKLKIV